MVKKLDKNKKIILTIIAVLILCVGSTLAYIIANLQDSAKRNASVTSDAVDILKFDIDKDINLNPTQFNVVEGGDNLQDTAIGSAILRANSTDNNATYNYYVYFNIKSNNYIYTTNDYKPEIVLTIINPEGSPVTSIDGLDYVTSEGVSGFDITTKSGLYEIAELYKIISTSSTDDTIQEWEFTVSFINLDTNQAENGGKTLEAEIILSRKPTDYHKVCEEGTLACDIAKLYNEEDSSTNGLYYHNGSMISENEYCMFEGNTVSAFPSGISTDATNCQTVYSFAGMLYDASVITGGLEDGRVEAVTWNSESGVCQTTSGIPVYNDDETATAQEQCSGYAALMGDTESIIMTNVGSGTIEKQVLDANDKSYRYAGVNPNNYVCFGSTASTCPSANLYRIIGVFGSEVKLIKNTSYGEYAWELDYSGQGNTWDSSTKPDIRSTLNTTFLGTLSSTWQNKIENHAFKVGGMTYQNVYQSNAKTAYNYEVGANSSTTDTMKIGLMYVSDYGYAASNNHWTTNLGSYDDVVGSNWLDLGSSEWTISRKSDISNSVLVVLFSGRVSSVSVNNSFAVRPVFYLNSDVECVSGTGTESDPFRIA